MILSDFSPVGFSLLCTDPCCGCGPMLCAVCLLCLQLGTPPVACGNLASVDYRTVQLLSSNALVSLAV